MPALPGMYNAQWIDLQAQKADADRLVIHLHEWTMNGSTLGPDGKRHMDRLVEIIPQLDKPILIADCDDAELNESRRQTIVRELTQRGVTEADALLAIGVPPAEGMYGREAVRAGTQREFGGQFGNNQNNFGGGGFGGNGGLGGALSGAGDGGIGGAGVGGGVY